MSTLFRQYQNASGNIRTYNENIVIDKIDKLVPDAPIIEGLSNDWKNSDITLTVRASDKDSTAEYSKSELEYYEYSLNGMYPFTRKNWGENNNIIISQNGDYTDKIKVRVIDKAGNISKLTTGTVKLNKENPIVTLQADKTEWTNGNVTITCIASDSINGLAEKPYNFNDRENWTNDNTFVTTENGKITVKVKNLSGNITTKEISVSNIDKNIPIKPTIEGLSNEWKNSDITLKVVANDMNSTSKYGESGIKTFEYSIDGGITFSEPIEWKTSEDNIFVINESGDYTNKIAVRVNDNAGNISELSKGTVKLNKNDPEINSITLSTDNWTNQDITVTVDANDALNSVDDLEYRFDNGEWQTNNTKTYSQNTTAKVEVRNLSGNTVIQTKEILNIDKTIPTGSINIRDNIFSQFLNWTTFGLFFKDTANVVITAEDEASGISKIEYFTNNSAIENKEQVIEMFKSNFEDKIVTVNNSTATFGLSKNEKLNEKFFIYTKIVDNAGKYEIIDSSGTVIYTDSETQTQNINYTKYSDTITEIVLSLNGNTIKEMVLDDEKYLIKNTDYSIKNGNIIELQKSYLNELTAGSHILKINYNPAELDYNNENATNEIPKVSNIELNINKAKQKIQITNLLDTYTYGQAPIVLDVVSNRDNSSGNLEFSSSNEDVAQVDENGQITIKNVGKFTVTVKKETDKYYDSDEITSSEVIIKPKNVYLTGINADNKIYDGTTETEILGINEAILHDVVEGDENFVDLNRNNKNAKAHFENKFAGDNKTVIFTGFELIGEKVKNYNLIQPNSVTANINKREVTIEETSVKNKVYDSTTSSELDNMGVINNKIGNDDLKIVVGIGTFENKDIGEDKIVRFTGFSLTGEEVNNYYLKEQPEDVKATITQAELNIDLKIADKQYDGLNIAGFKEGNEPKLVGILGTDEVILTNGTPTFDRIKIEDNIPISFTEFYINGIDAHNYVLIQPQNITANIYSDFNVDKGVQYTTNEPNSNGWFGKEDFIITAKDGYLLSETRVRTCIHKRLRRVWKRDILTILSEEEGRIS